MNYDVIVTSGFGENCYIVWDDETQKGIVIDPGDDGEKILATIQKRGVSIVGIYNTHAHFDHIGAVPFLKKQLKVPFALHPGDAELAAGAASQGRMFGLHLPLEAPDVDIWLEDGMSISVGNLTGTVLHTPGHTQGGVCFLFNNLLFVGDTLFSGSVGRSDLPGGDGVQLVESIQKKLMVLGDSIKVLSGHGPVTTIGREREYNPFIRYVPSF